MNTRLIAAVILGSFVLAGCGGGSSDTARDEADMQVADAQQERIDELEEDLADAQEQARLAQAAREREQAAKEREQAEKERLEKEAEEATARARAAESSTALAALVAEAEAGSADPTVNPKYRAPTAISNTTGVTFSPGTGAAAGRWYRTTFSNRGALYEDDIVVYSDAGAPKPVPIMEQYGDFSPVEDTNRLSIEINNTAHQNLISSSSFPTGGRTAEIELTVDTDDPPNTPDQSRQISGRFDGASGYFQCENANDACSVRHTGRGYVLEGGTWKFYTSKSSTVQDPDDNFMHFGWWKRKTVADGMFSYRTFNLVHGVTATEGGFEQLTGSATYEGAAIGQYAIYQPLGTQSNHGSFTAKATLTANFDTDRLSGSVTGFDVSPGWSVTLNETGMPNGNVATGAVSWTIDGNTENGGEWDGAFQSEISPYAGHIPDGVTGTFDAQYNTVGRLQGAFGAHVKP